MTEITFGICVGPFFNNVFLEKLIDSIKNQQWFPEDKFEIILVGNENNILKYKDKVTRVINFDEISRPGWITKKKNIVCHSANYETIVLVHDYFLLSPHWLKGFKVFDKNNKWTILLNAVSNLEGTRHADWLVNPKLLNKLIEENPSVGETLMKVAPHENHPKYVSGLPYNVEDLGHIQYISGGYVVIKRDVLEKVPMNESLAWGSGEDVEWSERLELYGYTPKFSHFMKVSIQKPGKWHLFEMPPEIVDMLREKYGSKL